MAVAVFVMVLVAVLGLAWCAWFWPWFRNLPEEMSQVNREERKLIEAGRSQSAGAAHGEVSIPAEGSDSAAVLQLADQRLYARKEQQRPPEWPPAVPEISGRRLSRR